VPQQLESDSRAPGFLSASAGKQAVVPFRFPSTGELPAIGGDDARKPPAPRGGEGAHGAGGSGSSPRSGAPAGPRMVGGAPSNLRAAPPPAEAAGAANQPSNASEPDPLAGVPLPQQLPQRPAASPPPSAKPDPILQERLARAIETLQLQGQRLAEQARADAIEIAFQIAARIVESELRTSPEPYFALVRSALRQVGEAHTIQIRVNPADAELLRGPRGNEASAGLSITTIEIVSDPSLVRGDCVVDTDFGHVDGRLATRFQELRRALGAASNAS
jgi:flagellar assembly protein FliH